MRAEGREGWAVGLLGAQPFLGPCLDEGRVPQRRTKDNYVTLGVGLVASPHITAQFPDPKRSRACFGSDDPGFDWIGHDVLRSVLVRRGALHAPARGLERRPCTGPCARPCRTSRVKARAAAQGASGGGGTHGTPRKGMATAS